MSGWWIGWTTTTRFGIREVRRIMIGGVLLRDSELRGVVRWIIGIGVWEGHFLFFFFGAGQGGWLRS